MKWILTGIAVMIGYLLASQRKRKKIKGKNIVILGASSGIGKQLGLDLVHENQVLFVARRTNELESILGQCKPLDSARIFTCDWTKEGELEQLVKYTLDTMKTVDHLILCAGIHSTLPFKDVSNDLAFGDVLDKIMRTNTYGPIMATRSFLPLLKSGSRITVISSASGVIPAPSRTLYSATKHALTGFFRSLRIELQKDGIEISIVMPGSVNTSLRSTSTSETNPKQPSHGMSVERCTSEIVKGIELGEREIYIPKVYQLGAILVNIVPFFMEYLARRKYNYK